MAKQKPHKLKKVEVSARDIANALQDLSAWALALRRAILSSRGATYTVEVPDGWVEAAGPPPIDWGCPPPD